MSGKQEFRQQEEEQNRRLVACLGSPLTMSLEEVLQGHQMQHGVPQVLPVQSPGTVPSVLWKEGCCKA